MTTKDLGILPTEKNTEFKELWQCSILLHGIPKIGKTKFGSDMPNPVFAATEPGQGFIKGWKPVQIFDETKKIATSKNSFKEEFIGMPGWEKFNILIHDLAHRDHDFKTLVVDTVDNLWLRCVKWWTVHKGEEYEHEGSLAWGKGKNLIMRDFNDTLTRACNLPLGVVFISHSMEKEYGTGENKKTKVVTTLPQPTMQVVNSMVDIILFITFEGDKRVIKTRASPKQDTGSRIPNLPPVIPLSYEGLIEAYTVATGGGKNAKETLIQRIHKGEAVLAESKVDGFEVEKRVHNSRAKHAGNPNLTECNLGGLETYLQHLQVKFEKGQTNGNSTKPE